MDQVERLKEIRRMANEISYQGMDNDYYNDVYRLKSAIDGVSRALGMFADIEIQRLQGGVKAHNPLNYVENKLGGAYDLIMSPTKDGKFIEKPKEYTR